jgi:predicted RNA-binding Zn-ribbon protein involved in translation (DUF1610 family)
MIDLHTDGNGVAGLLSDVLGVEATTVLRACHSCGARHVLGEHRAYHGAGVVLRCPTCGDVGARVAEFGARVAVQWRGTLLIERRSG